MNAQVNVKHDGAADVLYVLRNVARVSISREAPDDGYMILNYDSFGSIVGVQLMCASEMDMNYWRSHPDRSVLPVDILAELDSWFDRHIEARNH